MTSSGDARDTRDAHVVVIGEALVDIVGEGAERRELPGGSPANVAVALGRLGRRPLLLTCLADDARGAVVRAWLEASGAQVRASRPATGRTPTATVRLDATGSAGYDFDIAWDILPTLAAGVVAADVVHAGSIATVLAPGAAVVEGMLRRWRGRALLSFDPNARPAITPDAAAARAQVERLAALCDVLKVSSEDLSWYYPSSGPESVAQRLLDLGPELVVVTRGGDGSMVIRRDVTVEVPAPAVQVADTIGAGDTYTGALLDALIGLGATGPSARETLARLTPGELRDAGAWAARAAAITVSREGADPPSRAEMLDGSVAGQPRSAAGGSN